MRMGLLELLCTHNKSAYFQYWKLFLDVTSCHFLTIGSGLPLHERADLVQLVCQLSFVIVVFSWVAISTAWTLPTVAHEALVRVSEVTVI